MTEGLKQAAIIEEASQIARESVPKEDYQQQVDRWNRYQLALDKIEHQCKIERFSFVRHLDSSYRQRRIKNAKYIGASLIALFAGMVIYEAFTIDTQQLFMTFDGNALAYMKSWLIFDADMTVLAGILAGTLGWMLIDFGKLPETISFKCEPRMFIDDRFYVQRFIRGMHKEQKDPKVELPSLTMELPHAWIKQMSLLKGMETFQNHRLD